MTDLTFFVNHGMLSLLNSEVKFYAKVLASRSAFFMTKLVLSDQTGYVKSRLAANNVCCLLHIHTAGISSPCA